MNGAASRAQRLPVEGDVALRAVLTRWRGQHAWLVILLGGFVTLVAALLERDGARSGAADRALGGAALGIALPLVAYALLDGGLGGRQLRRAMEPIARHGGNARTAAAFSLALLLLGGAAAGATLALIAVLAARGTADPLLARDLASSLWIGALAGLAYASWLGFASTFGQRGGGRKWLVVIDFVLGASNGLLALPWPRGHVRNLLGGAPPLDLSQGTAALCLVAATALTYIAALARTPR